MTIARRRFPIRQNLYARAVTFLHGTALEINDVLKREYPGNDNDSAQLSPDCIGKYVIYVQDGYEADYICLVKRCDRAEMTAALAHECLNHTAYALRKAGLPLADESEEAYCYYFAWIFRNCLEVIP